jgi:hypothetical protein
MLWKSCRSWKQIMSDTLLWYREYTLSTHLNKKSWLERLFASKCTFLLSLLCSCCDYWYCCCCYLFLLLRCYCYACGCCCCSRGCVVNNFLVTVVVVVDVSLLCLLCRICCFCCCSVVVVAVAAEDSLETDRFMVQRTQGNIVPNKSFIYSKFPFQYHDLHR